MSLPSQEPDFDGLHVAAFESRRTDDLARLIERNHGVAHVSPSMREVALDENQASIDLANRIMTGEVDVCEEQLFNQLGLLNDLHVITLVKALDGVAQVAHDVRLVQHLVHPLMTSESSRKKQLNTVQYYNFLVIQQTN